MKIRLAGSMLAMLTLLAAPVSWTPATAQTDAARTRLAAPVKVKQGMANVPALSPLWLLPEQAAKYNIQIEQILFQRFADERTALASGDLDIAAFGPQDITLGLGQGAKSMIGVAGIGSGNDCLLVRKGEDIKEWAGVGANYLKSLQGKEIDLAVVWHPFCAQGITEGWAQYPTITHNGSKTVGGLIAVLAVNRGFMEKHPDATQRLVSAYVDVVKIAQADPQRFAKIYAEKAGLPEPVASEAIRYTRFDVSLPLESVKRISKFLFDNGVIAREVSGEIGQYYTYEFLARATGRSAVDLGQNK